MRVLKSVQGWFELRDGRTAISRALLVAQFKLLRKQIPILYGVILAEAISIAYVVPDELPVMLRFLPPAAFVVLTIVRISSWLRPRSARSSKQSPQSATADTSLTTPTPTLPLSGQASEYKEVIEPSPASLRSATSPDTGEVEPA